MKIQQFADACTTIEQAVKDIKEAVVDLPKPAPAPAFCRGWGQCAFPGKAETQPCCGCNEYEPDEHAPDSVELGDWRGYKLTWMVKPDGGYVCASRGIDTGAFRPGDKHLPVYGSAELCNALLTAYRRAVERKLAKLPAGWEWLMDEIPEEGDVTDVVYLGRSRHGFYIWPEVLARDETESRRRAAALGLVEDVRTDRAEAALKAATGKATYNFAECGACKLTEEVKRLTALLASPCTVCESFSQANIQLVREAETKDTEILRIRKGELALTKSRNMFKQSSIENANEITRLRGEIAEVWPVVDSMKKGHDDTYDSRGCRVCDWLTRNEVIYATRT